MNWGSRLRASLCAAVLLVMTGMAGTARADDSVSLEAAFKGQMSKTIGWTFTQQLRVGKSGGVERISPQLMFDWQPLKALSFSAGYRYLHTRDNSDNLVDRYRAYWGATLAWDPVKRLQLRYRLRAYEEWRDERDDGTPERRFLTHRVLARYRVNGRWSPFVSYEIFQRRDATDPGATAKRRVAGGVEVDVGKRRQLSVMLRQTQRPGNQPSSMLLGLQYEYTLKD